MLPFVQHILSSLNTIVNIITIVARIMGIIFIVVGLSRLYRISSQSMMNRVSPVTTMMYFVVGTIFVMYTPILTAFSDALFTSSTPTGIANHSLTAISFSADTGQVDLSQCGGPTSLPPTSGPGSGTGGTTGYYDPHPFCPVMYYFTKSSSHATDLKKLGEYITWSIMFVIGLWAFLRGLGLLIKVGEGGQPGTLTKAFTHILAGLIGVNAETIFDILKSVFSGITPS